MTKPKNSSSSFDDLTTQADLTPSQAKFYRLLHKYVTFRGIDIVLHLRDGRKIELDKNRYIEGGYIYKRNARQEIQLAIPLEDITKADFYAA